jgi:transcriptional regulator with XRE-family HTH domain
MATNSMVIAPSLAAFLRERRERLKPAATAGRRRTPGLRREEVAARAGVSVTWYTWLEQGRGGAPSDQVLESLAAALELDPDARELLLLLAHQRPPPLVPVATPAVPPAVQHVIDAMPTSPALVKTPTWDVVAWNDAARAVLGDYAELDAAERNLLRRMFLDPRAREGQLDWEHHARFVIAVFRMGVARLGGSAEADALVAELQAASADFRRLWADTEPRSHGVGVKHLVRPGVGSISLETAAFSVDGAEGLTVIVFTPATPADAARIETLMQGRG